MRFQLVMCGSMACLVSVLALSAVAAEQPKPNAALTAVAARAKAGFHAPTAADLAKARGEVAAAAARLDARFAIAGQSAGGWKEYLGWDEFKKQLAGSGDGFTAITPRLAAGYGGLELAAFADLRRAVERYHAVAAFMKQADAKAGSDKLIDDLAAKLESYAKQATPDLAADIGEDLARLEAVGQAAELRQVAIGSYRMPNLVLNIGGSLASAGVAGPVDQIAPVDDCILGTTIHGTGHTVGQKSAVLVPSAEFAVFDTVLLAVNNSQSVGRNGPVCIYSTATTRIGSAKRLWLTVDGLSNYPAVTNAITNSQINQIQSINGRQLVERIAQRRADRQHGEADAIASEHAAERTNRRVDEEGDASLARVNDKYRTQVRQPCQDRSVFPQDVRFATTPADLQVWATEADGRQLAAATPPTFTSVPNDASLYLHQTMLNNMAATVMSGMILHEEEFQENVRQLLGSVPERFKPETEPWTLVFARKEPVTVHFVDNGLTLVLRTTQIFRGERAYPGMNVTVFYKFAKGPKGFKLVRQGDLQIFPPGFVPGSSQRLGIRETSIRSLMQRRLGKIFEPEVDAPALTPKGRLAKIGRLDPVVISSQGGWLTLAWKQAK
jgi:hypothetical protein